MKKQTTTTVKIIPGRTVSGKDIRSRMKNKTIREGVYGDGDYSTDEDLLAFTKMSRIEQMNHLRENAKKIAEMQNQLDEATNRKRKRDEEARIEREVQSRLQKLGKESITQQPNDATSK